MRRTPVDLTALVTARARDLASGGELLTLPTTAVTAELDVGLTARHRRQPAAERSPPHARRHRGQVEISEDGDDLVVTVSDQGPGVPDDAKEAIFRAFERHASRQAGDGLGLGLFIVRRFAELQGGRAWVEDARAAAQPSRWRSPAARGARTATEARRAPAAGPGQAGLGSLGSPRTRSPTMLRWISAVPAPDGLGPREEEGGLQVV